MHAGRFLPSCLIGLAALSVVGCVSDRYVGSVGATGTYSNRGYGVAVDLSQAGLLERWKVIDPREPESAPADLVPVVRDSPLDLDGDGVLHADELVRYNEPMLRLVSKTSTAARIDIDVMILGGKNAQGDLDALMKYTIEGLVGHAVLNERWEPRKLGPDYEGRVSELIEDGMRVAIIDHKDYLAEEGVKRRQLVKIILRTSKLTADQRADHNFILHSIALNAMSAPLTRQEQY